MDFHNNSYFWTYGISILILIWISVLITFERFSVDMNIFGYTDLYFMRYNHRMVKWMIIGQTVEQIIHKNNITCLCCKKHILRHYQFFRGGRVKNRISNVP